jgi:Xaa-Pro dipeptidase
MDLPVVGTFNKFPLTRWDTIPQTLQAQQIDALIAISPENVAYTSGHSEDILHALRDRISAVIIYASGDATYMPYAALERQARVYSWIKDIRGYPQAQSPIRHMANLLQEKGLAEGAIAYDEEFLTAQYFEELRGYLPKARFCGGSVILAQTRAVKTAEEIGLLDRAMRAMETAHLKIYQTIRPGDTELQIARRVHAQNLMEGADFTNHITVNAGRNTTIGLRYIPDETPIKAGDVVTIDTGCKFAGYTTDLSRPIVVGKPSEHQRAMWRKLWEANRAAMAATRPGVKASEMYAHLRSDPNFANVWFYAHSLGLFVHEPPLCEPYHEYAAQTSYTVSANWTIEPNMVLMVENALRDPEHGQNYHFEDMVVVTEDGCKLLTNLMHTEEMFVVE